MPYEVKVIKSARKIYLKFPPKLRICLDKCLAKLEEEPRVHPNIKKLKGFTSDYRYQVGGWRIMYEIDDENRMVTEQTGGQCPPYMTFAIRKTLVAPASCRCSAQAGSLCHHFFAD